MSDLRTALDEYLALRRALGFSLVKTEYKLRGFVAFAESEGATSITTACALRWAQSARADPSVWAQRLGMLRRFARWRAATDPRTEIPPDGLLPHRYRRKPPFLYSRSDVERLVAAARRLPSPLGLRARTFATLLALHAVTGLRTGESLALDRDDVDLGRRLLHVRRSKFGKSRLVPIHATTACALARYASDRDRLVASSATPAFFVSEKGTRVLKGSLYLALRQAAREAGLRRRPDGRGPRNHDFRHGFAIATLVRWYRAGADVEQHMPRLSTYLGHSEVAHTYWYLSATPELLRLAARRVERSLRRGGAR